MDNNLLLMMKDTVVMRINLSTQLFDVVDPTLLPYTMQNKLRDQLSEKDSYSKYEVTQGIIRARHNESVIINFLSQRILPISRENAKKIYNLFGFSQSQDDFSKIRISLACRALSLQDNYWVKLESDPTHWSEVDLRKNSLSDAVAQVSLHGSSLTLANKKDAAIHTPELTGQGAYAKAWFREPNGLYLYKKGANGNFESKVEVMVSNLLDKCNVHHLRYTADTSNDTYVCKCMCMTDNNVSILPGVDFYTWCNVQGKDSHKEALRIDPDAIYKMWIVDYLISNTDRHGLNWGFYYNCETMEILGCHPLYDHNNAFDTELMKSAEASYVYDDSMTIHEAALAAIKNVDFHFTSDITREDFLTDRQYQSFMSRAKELGIKVGWTYDDDIIAVMNKYTLPDTLQHVQTLLPNTQLSGQELDFIISKMKKESLEC